MSKTDRVFPIYPSLNVNLDRQYIWQLWILRTKKTKTGIKLLYSWITPHKSTKSGWFGNNSVYSTTIKDEDNRAIKFEIVRADYIGTGENIKNYIKELLKGRYLNEIFTEEKSSIPNSFLNLNLGENEESIRECFSIRPEILLPVGEILVNWDQCSIPNPTDYSVFSNQLFYHKKMEVLFPKEVDFDDYTQGIQDLMAHMKKETGFDMTKESSPRIGNIEWFRFPVADEDLEPLIYFIVNKENETGIGSSIKVFLKPWSLEIKTILIRCRIINGKEITLDQIKETQWSNDTLVIDFQSLEPVGKVLITIWEKDIKDNSGKIIFEKLSTCIRGININPVIIGNQYNTEKINLLDKLIGANDRVRERDLAKFNRSTSAESINIGSYQHDPWITTSRTVIDSMRKILPQKSDGQFFMNGWDNEKKESGQLSFIEWILDVISSDEKGSLLLIDPYFDGEAVEIFAHARKNNTKYLILTCTQHREKETDESDENSSTNDRINKYVENIIDACKQYTPLIDGLNLIIKDLRSIDKGQKALFHDRYLLLLNENGYTFKGFHLSNSLQGATRKAPLLVTPIPEDILSKVNKYVDSLLNPNLEAANTKKTEIVQIYPFLKESTFNLESEDGTSVDIEGGKLCRIPNVGLLFSKLLSQPLLESMKLNELHEYLQKADIIKKDESSFLFYNISSDCLEHFVNVLVQSDQEQFNTIISVLGECLAHAHSYDEKAQYHFFEELCEEFRKNESTAEKLKHFLNTFKEAKHFKERERLYDIFNEESFEKVIHRTLIRLDYITSGFVGLDYSYRYASKILVYSFPEQAAKLLEILLNDADNMGWNEGDKTSRACLFLISTFSNYYLRYFNVNSIENQLFLLKSEDFRLRAAGCATLIKGAFFEQIAFDSTDLDAVISKILDDTEYRIVLVYQILEKQNPVEYKILTADWIGGEDLIKRVIKVLSGNIEYNRSYQISQNFLDPLTEAGILTHLWNFNFWNSMLINKLACNLSQKDSYSQSTRCDLHAISDIGLIKSIIKYFLVLSNEDKIKTLQSWLLAMKSYWAIVRQPFAFYSNFDEFSDVSESIYIMELLLIKLSGVPNIDDKQKVIYAEFFSEYKQEITVARRYIEERLKEHPLVQLKEDIFKWDIELDMITRQVE